jgi:competence protein ComEA
MHGTIGRMAAVVLVAATLAAARVGAAETHLVNVNTASAVDLAAIKGIGPAKAQAIVEYREKNGGFKTIDDLKAVRGIGDKMVEQLRPQVTVGEADNASKVTNAKR